MTLVGKQLEGQTPAGGHLIHGKSSNGKSYPFSSFSPQGVKDAAKMDELVKGGMTAQDAAKSLNNQK